MPRALLRDFAVVASTNALGQTLLPGQPPRRARRFCLVIACGGMRPCSTARRQAPRAMCLKTWQLCRWAMPPFGVCNAPASICPVDAVAVLRTAAGHGGRAGSGRHPAVALAGGGYHRHAGCHPTPAAGTTGAGPAATQGRAVADPDRTDHPAGGDRAIHPARVRPMEDWPQGRGRWRAAAGGQGRPPGEDSTGLWPGRGDSRHRGQPHHPGVPGAAVPRGRLRRRHP